MYVLICLYAYVYVYVYSYGYVYSNYFIRRPWRAARSRRPCGRPGATGGGSARPRRVQLTN